MDPITLILLGLKAIGDITAALEPLQKARDEGRALTPEEEQTFRSQLAAAKQRLDEQV